MTAEKQPASAPNDDMGARIGSGGRDDLETIRLRHELAVDAAGIGSFDWDLSSNRLVWDARMSALMVSGVPVEPTVQDFVEHILPADRDAVAAATQRAIRACGDLRVDFRIIDEGGATRWLTVRGRVLGGPGGRASHMLGAVYDSSGVHLDRERAAQALDSMATAYATIDTDWRVSYANQAARQLLEGRGEPVGRTLHDLFPALADPSIDALLDGVMSARKAAQYEVHAARLGRWLEVTAQPVTTGIAVLVSDVTARREAHEEARRAAHRAEQLAGRLEFLASVADALGSTLDAEQAAARLARMLVPQLADWALVTLLDDDGGVAHIASHAGPDRRELVDRYAAGRRESLAAKPGLLTEVISDGTPLTQYEGSQFISRMAGDPAEPTVRALAPSWVTALPILARDRTLGVISLFYAGERPAPDEPMLEAAREVARRAGLVFDNARLYRRSQSMAVTLQRSLLTPAVQPADLEVRPHYVPAIADAQVGGDWYDAFQTADGTTTLVIGDVMGHDSNAAALMGQLRTLVRAIAVDRQETPSAVLSRVDAAAMALGIDTTATAVVAQILPDGPGARQLRWSNAGHPPPIVILPDGAVRVLDSPSDLLLGLGDTSPRTDHVTTLPPGATVLLFTDGLVEGRLQPFEIGMERLRATVPALRNERLEDLFDRLLAKMLPADGAEDDVALVAVRVPLVD